MKSLAKYLLHGSNNESPNRGKVLATNFAGSDIRSWSKEFAAFRKLKPNLSRAVAHISLNIAPDDREISDDEFIDIATKFKAGLLMKKGLFAFSCYGSVGLRYKLLKPFTPLGFG